MKSLARTLTALALVPVVAIALWAIGWRHWTCAIGGLVIAVFIVLTTLPRHRPLSGAVPKESPPPREAQTAPR